MYTHGKESMNNLNLLPHEIYDPPVFHLPYYFCVGSK